MKSFTFLFLFLFVTVPAFANTEQEKVIETFNQSPSKPYSILSPISSDAKNSQDAFKRIQQEAIKLNADAIIDLQCQAQQKQKEGWLKRKTNAVCQGVAIKWIAETKSMSK